MNFCKQQVLKKELKTVEKIIENGDFEEYRKIEQIIQKALQVGATSDDIRDVFENPSAALEKDSRVPIPLGIVGIDNLLKGGLGIGELGVVLAPTGTGKTTLLTKIANSAHADGKNVLQIFFEDNVTNILRKHYTIWSGIAPDDQIERKEEVIAKVKEMEANSKGKLKLLKMPSDSVTISEIKSKIRKLHSEGFVVDVLLIDYVDCISPERSTFGEEWKGEGSIMRSLEAMTSEFNIAIWTATQGNRESIASEVVTTDQMGGSIKKAQIGHVVMSVGKTMEQKEHNLATMTLLKSRIGRDGVIFQNCTFNNEMLIIDTDSQNTLLGFEEQKTQERANRAAEVYKKTQEKKQILIN
jgi:replicative DNA helicase